MMPASVLRIFGLGIFSWLLLGLGIYLAVEAYDEFTEPRRVSSLRPEPPDVTDDLPAAETATELDQAIGQDASQAAALDGVASEAVQGEAVQGEAVQGEAVQGDRVAREPEIRRAASDQPWKRWALLLGAAACLGLSLLGSWPVSLFMGNATGKVASKIPPTNTLIVGRPDGSQLHVEIYGDDARPTLLLTHGWSLDTSAWDYVKGDLASRYRLVAWDLAGLGKSQGPANADYSLEKMAHDLEAVIRATAVQAPLILVGHSIGGMILQTFCRLYPEHLAHTVHGLALVHTTYTNPLRTITANRLLSALQTPLIVPLNYLTIALSPLAWLSNWQSYFNGSLHIWTRVVSFAGKQSRQQVDHGARLAAVAWPATVARGNLAMLKFDEQQTLPRVDIPVLVVAGEHDRVTLPTASEHIEQLLPNDRPVVVDGGHLGYWEVGDRVADALSQFADHVVATAASRSADEYAKSNR